MGNQPVVPSELAEKHHITEEQVVMLLEAFKSQGNKRGKPIRLHKFTKALEEVHKQNNSNNFNHEVAEMLFSIFDVDKDGKVDVEEFLQWGVSVWVTHIGRIHKRAKGSHGLCGH